MGVVRRHQVQPDITMSITISGWTLEEKKCYISEHYMFRLLYDGSCFLVLTSPCGESSYSRALKNTHTLMLYSFSFIPFHSLWSVGPWKPTAISFCLRLTSSNFLPRACPLHRLRLDTNTTYLYWWFYYYLMFFFFLWHSTEKSSSSPWTNYWLEGTLVPCSWRGLHTVEQQQSWSLHTTDTGEKTAVVQKKTPLEKRLYELFNI